eukprot:1157445-Pelagomonas_calceolata.AAC.6
MAEMKPRLYHSDDSVGHAFPSVMLAVQGHPFAVEVHRLLGSHERKLLQFAGELRLLVSDWDTGKLPGSPIAESKRGHGLERLR